MSNVIDASDQFRSSRFKDFDAAFAENQQEPVELKIFGEVEQLPGSLPAGMVLKVMRLQSQKGDSLTEADMLDVAVSVFGTDRIDKWCNKGLDIVQLSELVAWALQQYGVGQPAPKDQPAPPAQASRGRSRSRSRSRR